jgi:hypothetical protein
MEDKGLRKGACYPRKGRYWDKDLNLRSPYIAAAGAA